MHMQCTYRRLEPDTVNGHKIQVIYTYMSTDSKEIDEVEEYFRNQINAGVVVTSDSEEKK